MRILIADDEELTRKGIISSIDWALLGITQIDSADDGVNALACAKKALPDILLTDVRMPRMDGIELSKKLRGLNPDCAIIFMSGYSDKEYLKAAINLKAVSYVEKPIVPQEITGALAESVALVQRQRMQTESNQLFLQEASSKLALALTQPGACTRLDAAAGMLLENLAPNQYFATMILKTDQLLIHMSDETLRAFFTQIRQCLASCRLEELHTMKHISYVILHLYSQKKPEPRTLLSVCRQIKEILLSHGMSRFHIILGDTVRGYEHVYESYSNAVLLLQSSFFSPHGSIFTPYEEGTTVSSGYLHQFPERFARLLSEKNKEETLAACSELADTLCGNRNLLPDQARDLYYKLFIILSNLQYEAKISSPTNSSLEQINNCGTCGELNSLLRDAVSRYFELIGTAAADSPTLFLIKDYINNNYSDGSLSIKDISEHVHLSSSYLCTVFKTETGQTLNQYLTNFRIEKAKQMLSDPRNKINEIAAQVGYSDCNYFGKTFKKVVGLSPSEYREKEFL